MDDRRIVVLFGDSLLMDTVEASLGENPELGVMRVHTNVPDIGARLKSVQPHLDNYRMRFEMELDCSHWVNWH